MKIRESKIWLWFIIAGAIIVIILGLHMLIMHCDSLVSKITGSAPGEVLSSQSVAQRSKSIAHVVLYILLLALALFHGLYGFRSLVQELSIPNSLRGFVDAFSLVSGIGLFLFGATAVIIGFLK